MRSSKSRSRSKQNRPRTLGNIINRVFESSGPEGKVRGTPQQVIEKYQQLARDAQLSNDRVAAENFLQHAEHYTRLLGEAQREMAAEQEARQQQFSQNGGQNGGQNGNTGQGGNGTANRDQRDRDQRPWREDRAQDAGSGDQPDLPAVIDFADGENGLVETPEAAVDPAPRREDRPRRNDRNDGRDRNRNRDDNRGERGPRRTEAASAEAGAEPVAVAKQQAQPQPAPQPKPQPAAEAPKAAEPAPPKAEAPKADAPKADAPKADADAKPRRPRAPRKPKEAGKAEGDPREAAE